MTLLKIKRQHLSFLKWRGVHASIHLCLILLLPLIVAFSFSDHTKSINESFLPLHLSTSAASCISSQLWGENGELWDPNGRLPDFSNAGYMQGDVPIPNWPIGVNVHDFGALGDGINDDTQAFRDAIAACPDSTAVFVPNGRYKITDKITVEDKDNFVLRGEDMYETVLYFPLTLKEIYPEIDYRTLGGGAFFHVVGGHNRNIENFTFEMKEERKVDHFDGTGANAIRYSKNGNQRPSNCWIRNIYVLNANNAVVVTGDNVTITNIVLDRTEARTDIDDGIVGHHGVVLDGTNHTLVHNVYIDGKWFHEIGTGSSVYGCVFSKITATRDAQIDIHAGSAANNLFTEIYGGEGRRIWKPTANNSDNFFWHINTKKPIEYHPVEWNTLIVGINTTDVTSTGPGHWHETINPETFCTPNLYLAQLAYFDKPLPADDLVLPDQPTPNPNVLIAVEDAAVKSANPTEGCADCSKIQLRNNAIQDWYPYYKFNLSDLSDTEVEQAKLRVYLHSVFFAGSVYAAGLTDDSWQEDFINYNNRPTDAIPLDTVLLEADNAERYYEWDITDFFNQELAGDKIVSLYIRSTGGGNNWWRHREHAIYYQPEILIVPFSIGLPVTYTSFTAQGREKDILLTWQTSEEEDNFGFYIERSASEEETDWETLTFVPAESTYRFIDSDVVSGQIYYYRLRQTDLDGAVSYSDIRQASILGTSKVLLTIFPNPSQNVFNYQHSCEANLSYTIYNGQGKAVGNGILPPGIGIFRLDEQPTGMYYIRFSHEFFQETIRLIKN